MGRVRTRSHAISWRSRLQRVISALVTSPRWISLLILLAIGSAFYFVGADMTYYVSQVEVAGAATLSQRAIVEASRMEGMHIFWLDPAGAARGVAEIPSILTATVEIIWPSAASVTVSERTPVLVWDQAGDRFWVDEEGRLMQARHEAPELLLILSQRPDKLYVGERIPLDVMAGALQLRQERPNIDSLFYEAGNGLSYEDGRNWRAYFGTGLAMNQKLAVYEALVADLQARGLQPKYISVINKDKPFYHLVEGAEGDRDSP
jgi:cell division septal protein FtsQ